MRRIISITALALLAVALVAAPAGAAKKSKKLTVSMATFLYPECTVAPDQVRAAVGFDAKVKRKNAKLPGRITVNYKLTAPDTGEVKVAEKVVLKPKDYINIGSFNGFTVGSKWNFDGSFTFKSTINGKRVTSKAAFEITIPTNEELAADGIKACA